MAASGSKLTAYERQAIALQIRQAEQAIAKAKLKLRVDEVNNCTHDWEDRSFTNGHNGNKEDNFVCRKCRWFIGHKPKTVEHM